MSGGGLMQLVAYGAQDVYLTANPQVTFFKQLYRRHSNFAMESIEQTFNGVANFGKRVQCTISRNGDLISRVYLQATLPAVVVSDYVTNSTSADGFKWVDDVGQALIDYVELEIGGQLIDKHYGDWLHIWNELTLPFGKQAAYDNMVGSRIRAATGGTPDNSVDCAPCGDAPLPCLVNSTYISTFLNTGLGGNKNENCNKADLSGCNFNDASGQCIPEYTLYVPLEFWFCRHSGLALPLIALQYHEVKVNIQFSPVTAISSYKGATNGPLIQKGVGRNGLVAASLWADYIYLDTEERRRFAQVAHEYLIEQLQFTGEESVTATSNNIKMSFNHPVKELVWVVQQNDKVDCGEPCQFPFDYQDSNGANPVAVAKIQLNGHDRFDQRFGSYFNYVQPYQHHTRSPATGINVYSFALKPEDHQPSGTCNFSRIDNAVLNLTLTPATLDAVTTGAKVRVYAVNYNVLRVMSGMGGLAYSN